MILIKAEQPHNLNLKRNTSQEGRKLNFFSSPLKIFPPTASYFIPAGLGLFCSVLNDCLSYNYALGKKAPLFGTVSTATLILLISRCVSNTAKDLSRNVISEGSVP